MTRVKLEESWSYLLGEPLGDVNYWVQKQRIPLGTLKPTFEYPVDDEGRPMIPEEDVVSFKFDPVDMDAVSREAMNILLLGGSGDGKSLILKIIWSVLHQAGYFCLYFDPKSTQSGRARKPWKSPNLPPHMEPFGIPIQHFMPVWATRSYDHMKHNFRLYTHRLREMTESEMWMNLGMTPFAATKVSGIIRDCVEVGDDITHDELLARIMDLDREELAESSSFSALRVLAELKQHRVVDDETPRLNLIREWRKGYSVCISFNSGNRVRMTFDIGKAVWTCSQYYDMGDSTPKMMFFDDSSYYAKKIDGIKTNFAVDEILNIGNNYRSRAVYNCMAVQSLGIIDDDVATTYKTKIISPVFEAIDGLSRINIPRRAIEYLKSDVLVADKDNHLMQFILIDKDRNVVPFFPFTPPCNHFEEVYQEKQVQRKGLFAQDFAEA